jgi:hypothetical protein
MGNAVENPNDLRRRVRERRALPPPEVRRALRLGARLTLAEAGEAIGQTGESVRLYETGERTPRKDSLRRYCDFLELLARELGR